MAAAAAVGSGLGLHALHSTAMHHVAIHAAAHRAGQASTSSAERRRCSDAPPSRWRQQGIHESCSSKLHVLHVLHDAESLAAVWPLSTVAGYKVAAAMRA
jgi:hypothetical protein